MRYAFIAPMNKTIYLRDDEVPIWERARELANDKLSPIIVAALKRFVNDKESQGKGFERIEIPFKDSMDNGLPKIKAFFGKWIYDLQNPYISGFDPGDPGSYEGVDYHHSVAETIKGNFVFFTHEQDVERDCHDYTFLVYPSFQAAAADPKVHEAAINAMEKRGVPIEELDI